MKKQLPRIGFIVVILIVIITVAILGYRGWKKDKNSEDDLNYSDTGQQWGLYKTRWAEINSITAPEFQFKIPFGWKVESESVNEDNNIEEQVVLSNDRGVTVTYWSLQWRLGGQSSVLWLQAEVSKADDAEFVPSYPNGCSTDFSSLGNFIVAKVQITGEMDLMGEPEFAPVDSGEVFYALVPESYLGTTEIEAQAGHVDDFCFEYPSIYAFIAVSPDGTFTAAEERDVIKILKSFKEAE